MEVVVHIGLHKTASTYMQTLLNDNSASLAENRVWYEFQTGYPAHHSAAWQILRGDFQQISGTMIKAQASGMRMVILSSEDLEGLLYRPGITLALCDTLYRLGARKIRFAAVLRRQSETFWSHLGELSKHIYMDPLFMYHTIMKSGYVYIESPGEHGRSTPFWQFCFDYWRDVGGFAANIHSRYPEIGIELHDFHRPGEHPGAAFLAGLGVSDMLPIKPGEAAYNRRLPQDESDEGFAKRLLQHGGALNAADVRALVCQRQSISEAMKADMTAAIASRFEPHNLDILTRYAPALPAAS